MSTKPSILWAEAGSGGSEDPPSVRASEYALLASWHRYHLDYGTLSAFFEADGSAVASETVGSSL